MKLGTVLVAVLASLLYHSVNFASAFAPQATTNGISSSSYSSSQQRQQHQVLASQPLTSNKKIIGRDCNYKNRRYNVSLKATHVDSEFMMSSVLLLSQNTFDPTTILSDIFGTVLGTPLILAIPIVAALLVATLIAYLIVAYANPAEEE